MSPILVTSHAVQRYQERVAGVSAEDARRALSTATITAAYHFGAHFVRLGSGHRVVLQGDRVITVLPRDYSLGCLDRRRDHLHAL